MVVHNNGLMPLQGENVVLLAYGASASGKSYTLQVQ